MQRTLSDFDYLLPDHRIACRPVQPRDSSRLLVYRRTASTIVSEGPFRNLLNHLRKGDLLVVNDSRVIPARLSVHKAGSGGQLEMFILRINASAAEVLLRPARRVRPGMHLLLPAGEEALVVEEAGEGHFHIHHQLGENWLDWLENHGEMPLPPYVARKRQSDRADREDYQTVYAGEPGSVAAPTAGLHFTKQLFDDINSMGVGIAAVTLHVGPGTFKPVSAEQLEDHIMHREEFSVSRETARLITEQKAAGGRIIAVGTTVVRVLEHLARQHGEVLPGRGNTDIFIREGFSFRIIDALITNFHLPRSTLLMLVAAFTGYAETMALYRHALAGDYRFYSYGDAMLIE